MTDRIVSARVHVHATFTTPDPNPLFMVAVEVLDGAVEVGHYVHIPFNPMVSMTVRILAVAPFVNDLGKEMTGLVLECLDEGDRMVIDVMNIGDELWDITPDCKD